MQMKKPSITVVNYYPLEEPLVGGNLRTYNLYRSLNEDYKVNLITLTGLGVKKPPSFVDFKVSPISERWFLIYRLLRKINKKIFKIKGAIPLITAVSTFFNWQYRRNLRMHVLNSKILISEHPYLFPTLYRTNGQLLVYNAHNVEYLRQKKIFGDSLWAKFLARSLWYLEKNVCRRADLIFATCEEDKDIFSILYEVDKRKISVIPNGVDLEGIKVPEKEEREKTKEIIGLSGRKIILFIGSYHLPNLEAVEFIVFTLAKELTDFVFLILGEVEKNFNERYPNKIIPANVIFKGVVSESEKRLCLRAADSAVNPTSSGSGTNIKMIEYMAYGLPIVTTPFGARGLGLEDGFSALVCELEEFSQRIRQVENDKELCARLKENARKICEEKYDWRKIAQKVVAILESKIQPAVK